MSQASFAARARQLKSRSQSGTSRITFRSNWVADGFVLIVVVAASVFCVSVYLRTTAEWDSAIDRHLAAKNRVAELKVEADRLELEIEGLKNDPRVIESYARENLGLVRAGDVVIKVDPGSLEAVRTVPASNTRQQQIEAPHRSY